MNDADLLAEFVSHKSEDAFKELVRLHVGMVFSVCRRQLGDAHWAEDVTQAVFILLARKAEELSRDVVLGGWLYKAAVYACSNARSMKKTRSYHEMLVMPMKTTTTDPDPAEQAEMEALLDEGLLALSKAQRDVLVLRFFESRPLAEIARMRKESQYATQKALDAGLARLRRFLKERGVAVTAGIIVAALLAQTARAVPVGLAGSVGTAALGGAGAQSTYVTQLVTHLVRHAGRAKLLGSMAITATVVLAILSIWLGVHPLLSANRPGMAAGGGGAVDARPVLASPDLVARWAALQKIDRSLPANSDTQDRKALWATLRKAESALRRMDVPAISEVVAFTNPRQKANWDEMVPVFAQNQHLKDAGVARFGKRGANLTAIKTFGERIDEILPQIDRASFRWSLGENQAVLYFAYQEPSTRGGSIFFVKEDGHWKIDAGMSVDVALEGLDANSARVAIQELDDTGRTLVREKMSVLQHSLTQVADHIAHDQPYDLAQAQSELEAADASAQGRAFFRLALRYDNAGQIRN